MKHGVSLVFFFLFEIFGVLENLKILEIFKTFEIFDVFEQNLKEFPLLFHLEREVAHCMESPFEVRIPLIQIDDVQINLNSN